MKIVYLSSIWLGYGGTEATVRNILYEMSRRGHECYSLSGKPEVERVALRSKEEEGVNTIYTTEEGWEQELAKIIDDETVVYTVLYARARKWQKVIDMGGKVLHEYNMAHQPIVGGRNDGITYIFNSKWTKSFYPQVDGEIIYPLVDISKFKVNESQKEPLAVGMVNPCRAKGSEIFGALAADETLGVRLLSCGGWSHKVNAFGKLDVKPNTHHMGNVECMSDFYNKIQVLLVPTQSYDAMWHSTNRGSQPEYMDLIMAGGHGESYGRVVIEAMAHGAAVIASNKDGLPEAVNGGGLLIGQFNKAEHWKLGLENVLGNIAEYKRKAAWRMSLYDYKGDVDRWEQAFKRALGD